MIEELIKSTSEKEQAQYFRELMRAEITKEEIIEFYLEDLKSFEDDIETQKSLSAELKSDFKKRYSL